MSFTIVTKSGEKTFEDKALVTISSKKGVDYCVNLGFDFMLTVQYDSQSNKCTILNQFNCKNILFKGEPLAPTVEVEKSIRLLVKDSDEYILIKVNGEFASTKITQENLTEQDLKDYYGDSVNTSARLKIEKRKSEIEQARVSIVKQTGYHINDLSRKLSMNSKSGILIHIVLYLASLVLAFGVSNYLTGLPLKDSVLIIHMPVNIKLLLIYSLIIYAIGLVLKQGIYLYLQNRLYQENRVNLLAEKIMITLSVIFYCGVYLINLLYYYAPSTMPLFAIFMSLFFTLICITLAMACGYFKSNNVEISKELNKYEYREDFEAVIKEYRQWIERYINNLTDSKITNIKDSLFNLQLKSLGEIILGIITAPFLAYGVSNTLAMCFPEIAGWIRISGLRFSPMFLTLATFMIIFAFFAYVNAFLCSKKVQASNVIKNDGFSNYLQHGVEIYGLEGVRKLDTDMRRSYTIGLCIIFIEFSMNISYFMQEMGKDFSGMFLSFLAALVPTALLIAETYMLSQTKFDIYTGKELISKLDR